MIPDYSESTKERVLCEAVLHKFKIQATTAVSGEALDTFELDHLSDHLRDQMVLSLHGFLASQPRAIWDVDVHHWPASWWDMWKATRCPRWLARHLAPPRYRTWTRRQRRHWTDLYPQAPVPLPRDEYGPRVVYLEQVGQEFD